MCSPYCIHAVTERLQRRSFFQGLGFVAAGVGIAATAAAPTPAAAQPRSFSRVVDLTHTCPDDFPTYFGVPGLSKAKKATFEKDGFNLFEWTVNEHTGTHLDAPIHFSKDGRTADLIPADSLVAPLVVIDIRQKAADNALAEVTPADIAAWEAKNGRIPEGACVAMLSGWDKFVASPKFRNVAADGKTMQFPSFNLEAAKLLMETRSVVGLAVDSLSIDVGNSTKFDVHYSWLPSNRWAVECIANLDQVPASGATVVVGGPKIKDASGGPSRVLALV